MSENDQYACAGDLLKLDIGKTHTKLVRMINGGEDELVAQISSPTCASLSYPAIDVARIFEWFVETAAQLQDKGSIAAVLPVAHGAAFATLKAEELFFPVMDYEFVPPPAIEEAYSIIRPQFLETGSPELPGMLNAAKQLFYLQETHFSKFMQIDAIIPIAQYFSFRLSGKMCSEVSALGCHTDLWNPGASRFSALVEERGWLALFPALAKASSAIGRIKPDLARFIGLSEDVAILAGGHDSSIEVAPHLGAAEQNTVALTTGTWFVLTKNCCNVTPFKRSEHAARTMGVDGSELIAARFMGGRMVEDAISNGAHLGIDDLSSALENKVLFASAGHDRGSVVVNDIISASLMEPTDREARAAAICHLVLSTLASLRQIGGAQRIIVLGRFAEDPFFLLAMWLFNPAVVVMVKRPESTGNPLERVFKKGKYVIPNKLDFGREQELRSLIPDYTDAWIELQTGC
ncbi:FGGY-family carbohydrate kinase [Erythrobacter sp. QSSC1-22B]|uniref:FGGY-family carbohydrate kinase n=1 Tax=Erythrobacter sp. QSSC1-22B TaxID=1860125 RepID=UPI00143AA910|nr:FGGY family carbohydrate kinase [Erythrobacter sp. QSSC1-22B]